jgi:tetratricopeptide (TPR) repeat protein
VNRNLFVLVPFLFGMMAVTGCDQSGSSTSDSTTKTNPATENKSAVMDAASAKKVDAAWRAVEQGKVLTRPEIDELKEIARKYPNSSDAVNVVSTTLDKWSDFGGLAEFLRSLPPTEERADYLATVLIKDSQFDQAIELLKKLLEADPENHIRKWRMGYALSFAGRDEEAVPYIRASLEKLSGEEVIEANNILGQYHLSKNELDVAEKHYKAATADPTSLQALLGMAAVYERRGDTAKSEAYQNQALIVRNQRSEEQINKDTFTRQMTELGEFLRKKDYDAAEKLIAQMRTTVNADQIPNLNRVQDLIQKNKLKKSGN